MYFFGANRAILNLQRCICKKNNDLYLLVINHFNSIIQNATKTYRVPLVISIPE